MSKARTHQRVYGQFFTPEAVVACCYGLIEGMLPGNPIIVDPACGDGAFLRYALEQAITSSDRLYGCDLDPALIAALVASGLPHIRHADGLAPDALPVDNFDAVVGNPPFGVATSGLGRTALPSEARFLLHALQMARPGGVVALILPSGILANERLRALRDDVLARCTVLAVIALPRDTFRHTGTSAACSILVLRNAPAPLAHSVCFGLPNRLDDLAEIVAAYHARPSIAKHITNPNQDHTCFWLPQTTLTAHRMDAHFWRPEHLALGARMSSSYQLRPLGALLDRRSELVAGDHVRQSRGEAKGPGLPYEYYQTRGFLPAGYNYAQLERCDERAYRRLSHTAVRHHDVLISCAGVGGAGRGRVCLVTHQPGPSCTGDVLIVRPRQINPVFLFLFLCSQAGRQQLLRLQNGVGTANLSVNELLQVSVPLLAPAEQARMAEAYAPIARAHHASMIALQCHDRVGFQTEYSRATALLADLLQQFDTVLLGIEK